MKTIVVAYDQQRGIGANNDLPWKRDIPADLKHFRAVTNGGSVIMGRLTYESIGRPLPGRQNIVISRQPLSIQGVQVVNSLEQAYMAAEGPIFILGGGTIYKQTIDHADQLIVTEVKHTFKEATAFFPELSDDWVETSRQSHKADSENLYDYDFVTYRRR